MIELMMLAMLQQTPTPPRPAVTIPRVDAVVTIDGRLDEDVWQQATRLADFHQYEPIDGRPAAEQTEVRVWYAPDAIYFGVQARDSEPDRIRATRADRDNIDGEDHVVFYLDTFADRRRAFMFAVNALGVQQDGVRTEGAASAGRIFGGNIDTNPDFIFESRGVLTDDGYTVEVRIPFKTLRFPAAQTQDWGLQVERMTQRTGFRDTWTDVRRASASYLLQAGTITGLHDLQRGLVYEAQPFMTVARSGALEPAGFERSDPVFDAGANLKLSFSSVALDATINPDFSQVESDAGQVTINERFDLFFPEKRPFFLEGIELFNTPNQLVYTRQIVDPLGGAKISGKLGPLALAYLSALDENVNADGNEALFNVMRVRRDFGQNSLVGLTATDRSVLDTDAFNRVVAGDVRVVFGRMYYAEAQLGGAWTRDIAAPGAETDTRFGELWKLELDRTGRGWGFNYQINAVDGDFVTRSGFLPRNGIVTGRAFNRLSLYGAPGALLETVTTFFGPSLVWRDNDFDAGDPLETTVNANTSLRFRGGWTAGFEIAHNGVDFLADDYAHLAVADGIAGGERVYTPLGAVKGAALSVNAGTPTFQRFDASARGRYGVAPIHQEGGEGRSADASFSVSLRPSTSMRVGASASYRSIQRSRDDSEFAREIIPRVQAEYQPTRALFFRVITQVRSERQAALLDARTGAPLLLGGTPVPGRAANELELELLLSYEPTPGTVAYFGYGSSHADPRCSVITGCGSFRAGELDRVRDGLFVKLAYLFRS